MIRKFIMIVLISASAVTACTWAWTRAWDGVIGGWSLHFGDVTLKNAGYGDVSLAFGKRPGSRWRPNRFSEIGGFGYATGLGYSYIKAPFWFLFCVFGAYPLFVLFGARRRRKISRMRQLAGLCTQCGYNLTGLPEPRCPECSAVIYPTTVTVDISKTVKLENTSLLFVSLGIGYWVLSWLIWQTVTFFASLFGPSYYAIEIYYLMTDAVIYGAFLGFFWCAFGVPLLYLMSMRRVIFPLAIVAAASAIVSALLIVLMPSIRWVAPLIPTLSLLIACTIVRRSENVSDGDRSRGDGS